MYTKTPMDNPGGFSGPGGMEAWDGENWIPCDYWMWYDEPGNNVDFAFASFQPQAGGLWRLTNDAPFQIGGVDITPRTGTFSAPPEMLRAGETSAKIAVLESLTGKRDLLK